MTGWQGWAGLGRLDALAHVPNSTWKFVNRVFQWLNPSCDWHLVCDLNTFPPFPECKAFVSKLLIKRLKWSIDKYHEGSFCNMIFMSKIWLKENWKAWCTWSAVGGGGGSREWDLNCNYNKSSGKSGPGLWLWRSCQSGRFLPQRSRVRILSLTTVIRELVKVCQ